MKISPLLSVGTFGVHVLSNPAGTFSFSGEVPHEFRRATFETLDDGIKAFVGWFKRQSLEFQREHVGNLRNDVFAMVMES